MKALTKILQVLVFSLAGSASPVFAANPVPVAFCEPFGNPTTEGHVVTLLEGEFTPKVIQGGFGPVTAGAQMRLVIEVQELSNNKVFKLVEKTARGFSERILGFDDGSVRYLGSRMGRGQHEINVNLRSLPTQAGQLALAVIMPARRTTTPTINDPTPGFSGPTYGLRHLVAGRQ